MLERVVATIEEALNLDSLMRRSRSRRERERERELIEKLNFDYSSSFSSLSSSDFSSYSGVAIQQMCIIVLSNQKMNFSSSSIHD